MNYLIVSALNGLIVVLLFEYLFIRHLRKELEYVKKKNEDDLREVFQLRGENACLREEVECLKRGDEVELQKLREENDGLRSERDELNKVLFSIGVAAGRIQVGVESIERKMDRLRTENEALKKELLEQVERQNEDAQ